jgi:hypothetical protein
MTPRERFVGAAPMTFLAWVVPLALSAPPAIQGTGALWHWLGRHPEGIRAAWAPGGGTALEILHRTSARDGATLALGLLGSVAILGLLTPWLSMAWLAALDQRRPLPESLRLGLVRYLPSLGATLLMGALALGAFAFAMLPPGAVHLLLRDQPDERLHDLAVAAAALPALAVVLLAPTAHDLARVFLTRGPRGPVQAVWRALFALRPRLVAAHLGYRLAGAGLALGAAAVALWPTGGAAALVSVVGLGQLAALARTSLRGRWLALAVHRTRALTPGFESPAPRGGGSTPPTR